MLTEFLGAIWRYLPSGLRSRLVRTGQRRFTVTAGVIIFDEDKRVLLLTTYFGPMAAGDCRAVS